MCKHERFTARYVTLPYPKVPITALGDRRGKRSGAGRSGRDGRMRCDAMREGTLKEHWEARKLNLVEFLPERRGLAGWRGSQGLEHVVF